MAERQIVAETSRLLLRRYCEEDLQDLFEYLSDEQVVRYEPYQPMNRQEVAENLRWRMATEEMVAVELKSQRKMIGNVYLGKREFDAIEIGYVFHRQFWGQGYAAESCRALIEKVFSEGIHRVYAECDPCNIASWRLLERLGFQREAHYRQNIYFWKDDHGNPLWKDTYVYAMLSKDAVEGKRESRKKQRGEGDEE